MSENKNSTDRHQIRNTLLANGYTPLPLARKGCYITGWSRADIDEEWLATYKRQAKYPNTGLRCDKLIAFDIDVLDERLADELEDIVEYHVGRTELCRVGKWPKRLLLYRLKGDQGRTSRTGRYGEHMVELLCSNGRQFAAYGKHPGTGQDYEWLDDVDPLNTPFKKLPAITYMQAEAALEQCDLALEATGIPQTKRAHTKGLHGDQEFDLTHDFPVRLNDGRELTWGELREDLTTEGVFGNILREDGEFGDSDAVHFYLAHGSNEPCAHDFIHDCTHWEQPIDSRLAELLPEEPQTSVFDDDEITDLVENYVIVGDGSVRNIEEPMHRYRWADFKLLMAHLKVAAPTARNPAATKPAVDAWREDPRTLRAKRAAMCFDKADEIIVTLDNGVTVFNTYDPPQHPESGGDLLTVFEFVEHLIPKDDERELFWDWHALKVAHPDWRMHALIMVTPAFGTGRGTWFQILERVFGQAYVNNLELKDLIGTGSQAAYNDYLADSLFITVPEALEEKEDQTRWAARHLAYERMKTLIEPVAGKVRIKRKYGSIGMEMVHASTLISSNHIDALAIEPGDRRLVVIDNTETPILDAPGFLYDRIHDWKDDARNIGALHRYLAERAERVTYNPFGMPPLTPAKSRMIEAGQSDTDAAFEYMLETADGDIVTPGQWAAFAQQARISLQLDLPIGDRLQSALNAVIQKRARRPEALGNKQIKVDGTPCRVWIIRNWDKWKGNTDVAQFRAEVQKNGAVGGNVAQFPGSS